LKSEKRETYKSREVCKRDENDPWRSESSINKIIGRNEKIYELE